ncbi:hypothetical protein [Thermosulfurimonas dismutans]|uniref:Uncharacterized protein n=1 Tax=Thermosulfurimonas dismutans TaxID=999894 RepID=A0A179D3J7_9BACT|nr:hypothetical protein [Thermosulfurimonas dismutans]OAQ20616.1 hypothetical protein TDIS_1231 [Thermosulfurimonas dismutans]
MRGIIKGIKGVMFKILVVTVAWINIVGYALAVETTMIVKLQEDIRNSFKRLDHMQKEYEGKVVELDREIQEVIQEIGATKDPERRNYLAKRYFRLRAEILATTAKTYAEIHDILVNTISKMEKLYRLMEDNEELSPLSEDDKRIVSNIMVGLRNLFYSILESSPNNPRLALISHNIKSLDERFRRFFRSNDNISFQEQIDYLTDLAASIRASLSLLEEERGEIFRNIYQFVQTNITNQVFRLKPTYYNIVKNYSRYHKYDAEVLSSVRGDTPEADYPFADLNSVGQY